jgi:hypothetical protein
MGDAQYILIVKRKSKECCFCFSRTGFQAQKSTARALRGACKLTSFRFERGFTSEGCQPVIKKQDWISGAEVNCPRAARRL